MTARQPRRTRRRAAPANTLPRPVASLEGEAAGSESAEQLEAAGSTSLRRPATVRHREHHVTTDYSHVHRDLAMVAIIGTLVVGFVVGMSFVVG